MSPKVSIVIPTHNRADMLRQTLDSVTAQTDGRWEAVVVDDGSTDSTRDDVSTVTARDARVRLITQSPGIGGAQAARNLGLGESTAEYVLFLDSDDLLLPQALAGRIAALDADPSLDFVVFATRMFRRSADDLPMLWNAHTEENDFDRFLRRDTVWLTTGPTWRRASLVRTLGESPWDVNVPSSQDWDLHLRALAAGLKYVKSDQPDSCWRLPDADRESTSKRAFDADHLKARPALLAKILRVVRDAGLLTDARRQVFAGLYLQTAERTARKVSRRDAAKVWDVAWRAGLVSLRRYVEGRAYLLSFRDKRWNERFRTYLESTWPPAMLLPRSPTLMTTPLDPDAPATVTVFLPITAADTPGRLRETAANVLSQSIRDVRLAVRMSPDVGAALRRTVWQIASQDRRVDATEASADLPVHVESPYVAVVRAGEINDQRRLDRQVLFLRTHRHVPAVATDVGRPGTPPRTVSPGAVDDRTLLYTRDGWRAGREGRLTPADLACLEFVGLFDDRSAVSPGPNSPAHVDDQREGTPAAA